MSMSLDGFVAGPDQTVDDPIGRGGMALHEWHLKAHEPAVRQALRAGAVDDLYLDIVPVLLGSGESIFDGVPDPGLTPVQVTHSPHATHVHYRVGSRLA